MHEITKFGENQATYTMNDLPLHKLSIQQINIPSIFTHLSHIHATFNSTLIQHFRPAENFTRYKLYNY